MNEHDVAPCLEEIKPGSRRLYLVFGGMASMIGVPPFEFYKTARIIDDSRIFFRDISQSWYQCGLPGMAKDVYELADFIREKIRQLNPAKVYYIGNSMGGFAAILFSALIGHGSAITFSPQTFLSFTERLAHSDARWYWKILRMYYHTVFRRHIYNLRDVLINNDNDFEINIHVSMSDHLDMKHAMALHGFRQVKVHHYAVGGHDLVKYLRNTGTLAAMMTD